MRLIPRFACIAATLLLTACSAHSPQQPAHVQPTPHTTKPRPQSSIAADEVLLRAMSMIGTPYRWGGNTPEEGFDCSGLIVHAYRGATGLRLPRTTREMNAMRAPSIERQKLRAGDLVFFATSGGRQVSHAGIYVGDGRFVHAPRTGTRVRLDRLDNSYWNRTFLGARRVLAQNRMAVR